MNDLNRMDFLKAAGAGTAALAGAAGLPLAAYAGQPAGTFTFSAATGLPRAPLPSYATHIVEGRIDSVRGTGFVTSRVVAGHPGDPSLFGLPGLARMVRVIAVDAAGPRLRLRGVVEDRSQLLRGERHEVEIVVDRKLGVVTAPFLGRPIEHRLAA